MNELGNTPADKNYKPSGIISEEYPEKVKVAYLQGYEQAEKDLALTWKDVENIVHIYEIAKDVVGDFDKELYEEVLTRFKKYKEAKK